MSTADQATHTPPTEFPPDVVAVLGEQACHAAWQLGLQAPPPDDHLRARLAVLLRRAPHPHHADHQETA